MPQTAACQNCGTRLRQDRFNGLCPNCLWRGLAAPDDEDDLEAAAPIVTPPPNPDAATRRPSILLALPGLDVVEELARGGMGIVYRARQLRPGRFVALKMLPPHLAGSRDMRARFRTECRAAARLDHPAILPIHEVGEHEGIPFFTMKLATGGSLAERRRDFLGRFRDIAAILATLARAMQFAHERGILHRDLKPGNILFDENQRPYVADFGLAKLFDSDDPDDRGEGDGTHHAATHPHSTLGTPHYMAPEIATGGARNATTASDIYGLGAILYELLAGRPPFTADSIHALLRQIAEAAPRRPAAVPADDKRSPVPRDLEVICLKCLEKNPADRYASARALAEDLERWLAGRPILARPATVLARLFSWARRNPVTAALASLLAAAVVVGATLQYQAYLQLRAALARSTAAQAEARENLRVSLIAQAQAQRQTRQPGQRRLALDSASRSAQIAPSLEARREAAAALAVSDFQGQPRKLPAFFANGDSTAEFTSRLDLYAVGRHEGGFTLRRTLDGAIVHQFASSRTEPAHEFQLSPDDRIIFATWLDGSASLWAIPNNPTPLAEPATATAPLQQIDSPRPGTPRIAFHPGRGTNGPGYLLVFADGTARWHESATATGIELNPPMPPLLGASFGPDGRRVALVRTDGALEIREWPGGRTATTLPGSFSTPEPAWSPDGHQIAVGSRQAQEIMLIDTATGAAAVTLRAAGLNPTRIAFHPDGQRVAAVGSDRVLRLWDTVSGHELLQLGAAPRALRFSADGRHLAFAPGHLELAIAELAPAVGWRPWPAPVRPREHASGIAIHPEGTLLASADPSQIQIWDPVGRRPILSYDASGTDSISLFFTTAPVTLVQGSGSRSVEQRALHPEAQGRWGDEPARTIPQPNPGKLTSLGPAQRLWLLERYVRQEVALWPDGDPTREQRIPIDERFNGATLSPDGRLLATLNAPLPGVTIRQAETGRILHRLDTQGHATAGFSPDGQWLVTGTSAEYCFWNPATGQPVHRWPARLAGRGHGRFFFSHSGRLLALLQERDALSLIDPRSQQELITLTPPVPIDLVDAVWAPDDAHLYLLDGSHRIYEWSLTDLHAALAPLSLDW